MIGATTLRTASTAAPAAAGHRGAGAQSTLECPRARRCIRPLEAVARPLAAAANGIKGARPSSHRGRAVVANSAGAQTRDQWSATDYNANASFVSDYGKEVVKLLDPRQGERILDLGCGEGALAAVLQAHGCSVIGVDSSPDMVQAALRKGVAAQVMDGQNITLDSQTFDAVFSNAALHWMKADPDAVLRSAARVLKPGGRFVGEMGGHGNVASITVALSAALTAHGLDPSPRHPWYFPSAQEYAQRLRAAGFQVHSAEILPRPTVLPTGIRGWLETFSAPWLEGIPEDQRQKILAYCEELLQPALRQSDGTWSADYVRLRFHATLESQPELRGSGP